MMEISVHVDHSLHERAGLQDRAQQQVSDILSPFTRRLMSTRIQLDDETHGHLGNPGVRCLLEATPSGHAPVVVVHHASSTDEAVKGAAKRMRELLDTVFGRLDGRHPGGATIRGRA